MFTAQTPALLTAVTFTTEEVDEETRRVVVCTFALAPFTPAQAEALNVRSLIFEASTAFPKAAIDTAILSIDVPLQRLTLAMAPDIDTGVVLDSVQVVEKVRVKVKRDREPAAVEATFKLTFRYPSADDLFSIVNSVTDTLFLTFEAEQLALGLTSEAETAAALPKHRRRSKQPSVEAGDELRPGVAAEH